MKRLFYFLLTFLLYLLLPALFFVHASDFSFDYNVYYSVKPSGKTAVTQHVSLTNEQTNLYAQNFTLTITSEKITNVEAYNESGTLSSTAVISNGQTIISIPFSEKAVGIGKKQSFTLNYESGDIAQKKGRIWEILIPGIEKQFDLRSYTVHLDVPQSFGLVSYVSPKSKQNLVWTLDEFGGKGITAAFGDYQNFRFNLKYALENTSGKKQTQEITLPPETPFQKVIVSRISIRPANVVVDSDGNWLAQFELQPKQKREIIVEGNILVYPHPTNTEMTFTDDQLKKYTLPQQYWENDPAIIQKAQELKTPQKIYEYVMSTLSYDYSRVQPGIKRLGALEALKNPTQAVCTEFSDLFVALTRAAGIPAREIHGYAYTNNPKLQPLSLVGDVLHAWPQYYDENKRLFISVDPTWGNTTRGVDYFSQLDFNHIALAILGERSDYPYPAGSFRTDENGKNVFIDSADASLVPPRPEITVTFPQNIHSISGKKNITTVHIENTGRTLFTTDSVITMPDSVSIADPHITIPPYGSAELKLMIEPVRSWKPEAQTLQLMLNGQTFTTPITIDPFYKKYLPSILILGIILLSAGILKVYGSRRFRAKN